MLTEPHLRPLSEYEIVDYLRLAAVVFTVIGALNWGLMGLQGIDLVVVVQT